MTDHRPATALFDRLKRRLRGMPGYAHLARAKRILLDPQGRSEEWLRFRRRGEVFQHFSTTAPDRYPREFRFVREAVGDGPEVRLLSFGCASGEEVFSLRAYFPCARITGIDINPRNIAACRGRQQAQGDDPGLAFTLAGSAAAEPDAAYDAIFGMAVFRNGLLHSPAAARCDSLIRFADFERQVAELARCLKPGGLLLIRHANFRFADTAVAAGFETVMRVGDGRPVASTPLYGRDDRLLPGAGYADVGFRKRS